MKKNIVISVIILGILTVGIYFVMNILCEIGVKCKNCTQTSISVENSKKNGFYLMKYTPLNSKINLKYHDEEITFSNAWVESQWFYNSEDCLNTRLEKRDGYNIIFEFEKSNKGTFLFSISPVLNGVIDKTNGGILETKKEIRLNQITDTLWLQIHEKNPNEGVGWQKELNGELIGFVKKKNEQQQNL